MIKQETSRLSRLTSILIQLQTKQLITATELANKFSVSVRTIYRDIRTLEQAGVPIAVEDGRGYQLMDGYNIPPVMFSEEQVNALILAEQLVLRTLDESLIKNYSDAVDKIKAVLSSRQLKKVSMLTDRTRYDQNLYRDRNSNSLSEIQLAITNYSVMKMEYKNAKDEITIRLIEPFALINSDNWLLIAYCRLREEFRFFRLDRIISIQNMHVKFEPHNMSLQEYFNKFF